MELLQRFVEYCSIDTQSCPDVNNVPSTEKQKDLSRLLYNQLKEMGAQNVTMDNHGYVYATIPSNMPQSKFTLGFIAHVDTSPAVSGANVKPCITNNYKGEDIVLKGCTLSPRDFPTLLDNVGKTIITSDGTTLLGADDKAGVAEIMDMAERLLTNPSIKHGTIKIAFTPDEEVGNGTAYFDVKGFGCDGAYTVDGGELGGMEYENFNAASADIIINGLSVHPGSAKGYMKNAVLIGMELQSMLPVFDNPMYTEGYEGFYHLEHFDGSCEHAKMFYIIRDHDKEKFEAKKQFIKQCVKHLNTKYGKDTVEIKVTDSYYNMKEKLTQSMHLVDNAKQAMSMCGISPCVRPIRGGTDGAMLSYKGLPCPNLFTGGYNYHGRYEYIPYEDMQKAVEVLLKIVDIYKDR